MKKEGISKLYEFKNLEECIIETLICYSTLLIINNEHHKAIDNLKHGIGLCELFNIKIGHSKALLMLTSLEIQRGAEKKIIDQYLL